MSNCIFAYYVAIKIFIRVQVDKTGVSFRSEVDTDISKVE